jgi:5-methylcytosine-specific restriction endonuclease McrA
VQTQQPQPQKGGSNKPKKKKAIPAALRKQVWNHYIGGPVGETKCPVCRHNTIDKLGFEAGHVIPECAGGSTTLPNLRPICGECNQTWI